MRQSRVMMEEAYRKVYKIPSMSELSEKDDSIINRALMKVRLYAERFDGEESISDNELVDKREQDRNAVTGDPSSLVRYFKSIGTVPTGMSDWEAIFTLYRNYIDPVGKKEYQEYKERMNQAEAEKAEVPTETASVDKVEEASKPKAETTKPTETQSIPKQEVAEETKEVKQSVETKVEATKQEVTTMESKSERQDSSYINNTKQEDLKMDGTKTIGDFLNLEGDQNGGIDSSINAANALVGGVAGQQMNLNNTNVQTSEGVLTEEDAALAKSMAESQNARRAAWNNENKIKYFVLGNYPIGKRMVKGTKTGDIKNPEKVLEAILNTVWKDEGRPDGMDAEGKVDGVIAIPKCVSRAKEDENYTKVITTLCEAKNGGNKEINVNMNVKMSNFRGVVVATPKGEVAWTMAEAKKEINMNGKAKLEVDGLSDTQLQTRIMGSKAIQKKRASKDQNAKLVLEDITQLQIPGRDNIIDMTTSEIKDPERVKVYNELDTDVSKATKDDRIPAYSELCFRYIKDVKTADAKTTAKKFTKRIPLVATTYAVKKSEVPVMQSLAPKQGVGVPINKLSPEGEAKVLQEMFSVQLQFGIDTADEEFNRKRAEIMQKRSQSEAEAAAQNINASAM